MEGCAQLEITYDTSKEPSNQQLQVRVPGSSNNLSLLSRWTSKVQLPENPRAKNTCKIERKQPFRLNLTHALNIRRHVTSR